MSILKHRANILLVVYTGVSFGLSQLRRKSAEGTRETKLRRILWI